MLPFALPAWLPWQPPITVWRWAILGPLPLTAHAAVLRFGNGEVVRVPLNQTALRRQRVSRPRRLYFLGSVVLRLDEVTDTHIIVEFTPAVSIMGTVALTAHGHAVPLTQVDDECGGASADGYSCRAAWVFPPQRRGTHMLLTIPSFGMTGSPGLTQVTPGTWRIALRAP